MADRPAPRSSALRHWRTALLCAGGLALYVWCAATLARAIMQ